MKKNKTNKAEKTDDEGIGEKTKDGKTVVKRHLREVDGVRIVSDSVKPEIEGKRASEYVYDPR